MPLIKITLFFLLLLAAPVKAAVTVSVGIEPLRYLVEQVGGERVTVNTLLSSGDPHALDPTPSQLLALKKSELYFGIGLPFERSLGERLGDAEKLVWLGEQTDDSVDEYSGHGHGHGHGSALGLDLHRWTSPAEMMRMGVEVVRALSRVDPQGAEYYGLQQQQFRQRVQALQLRTRERLQTSATAMVADHPAWGWFCAEFSLRQLTAEQEGKLPSIRQMMALKKDVSNSGARVIVSEHGGVQAQTLASRLGVRLLVVNPLSYEWETAIDTLTEGLAKP